MKLSLPGSLPITPAEQTQRGNLVAQRGPNYRPRTHYIDDLGVPHFTNRLIGEVSPYLLQHAHNPVDWYPWGDEAFQRAQRENKPVLLSVGYSTCHWCHVMEQESFEDVSIAERMNSSYVCIKVDRELRPDVDNIYMQAVQAITGRGGWPMTVWLTPDRLPYYAGTYFPPRMGARPGAQLGFFELLERLATLYQEDRERVIQSADQLTQAVRQMLALPRPGEPGEDVVLHRTFRELWREFDEEKAGLGRAPFFPMPPPLDFCLAYFSKYGDQDALKMPTQILRAVARGGIYDHLGGGFHRYSTDDRWLVPHFEKMLYDQAGLVSTYTRAWQMTREPLFQQVVRETCLYVMREMTDVSGAFFAASDADSEGEEGTFFVWTREELIKVLGPEQGKLLARWYGVSEEGNFEGKNVLHTALGLEELAKEAGLKPAVLAARLEEGRAALFEWRKLREWPHVDTKVITSWSASMGESLARAGQVWGEGSWIAAGESALEALVGGGPLARVPGTDVAAYSEDYAACISACITLFEVTSKALWLERAITLQEQMDHIYQDPEGGGYFLTGEGGEALLCREKPVHDGVQVSSNAAAATNLLRLYAWTGREDYRAAARSVFRMSAAYLRQAPRAVVATASGLLRELTGPRTLIITGTPTPGMTEELLRVAGVSVAAVILDPEQESRLASLSPIFWGKSGGGMPTAYVCEGSLCHPPVSTEAELKSLLRAW